MNIDLNQIKKDFIAKYNTISKKIIVCGGTGCVSSGSLKIYDALKEKIAALGWDVQVQLKKEESEGDSVLMKKSGCQGFCQQGPLVTILPDNLLYCKVKLEDVDEIIEKTIKNNEPIERLLYLNQKDGKRYHNHEDIPFYANQKRITLGLCGAIDAESIEEYIANDGYFGAQKAYLEMSDKEICDEVLASGLRGRGGAGFPTGRKWDFARIETEPKKYIICNGDEGDPGAFMDRSIMEGNPHSVIEGMMIAAKAFGADEGYIYVRTEYPLACTRMANAIKEAENLGILGENIFGSGYNFSLHIMEGAGAFVCGEETALIKSVEGSRGMPVSKPPFPAHAGLFEKPTCINNVETLATVPIILRNGAEEYRKIGTPNSAGTKTFAVTGNILNTGLVEVPMGTTLRDIIFNIGGGVTDDAGNPTDEMFKSVQIGGPSGGCLTPDHVDIPI
ncbi:MAG: SLBB domain-containing protein, partial [Armatimonadetes bacterium]|nr:SLBB domain-containing protein [Candidatus Hippobium faecium]